MQGVVGVVINDILVVVDGAFEIVVVTRLMRWIGERLCIFITNVRGVLSQSQSPSVAT